MHTSPNVLPDDPRPVRTTRAVSYVGVLQQALRDLSDWVENGRVPPASTDYEVMDGQIVVPAGLDQVMAIAAGRGECHPLENAAPVGAWGESRHSGVDHQTC